MIRFFKNCLEVIAWLNIVLSPTAILGFLGYLLYLKLESIFLLILFIVVGMSVGIYIAERVRKTIGCSDLVFRMFSSKDIAGDT
jgi:hypothetical protein